MKTMKKAISLVLSICILIINSNVAFADDTTIKQWKYNGHTFGFTYSDSCRYNGGNSVKENDITTSINIYDLGNYSFYPYIRMRYKDNSTDKDYKEAYVTSNHLSTVEGSLVVECALENPNGFTIGLQSMWDGWTKTMTGLSDTGILSANNNDKNIVAHGGSLISIYTSKTPYASSVSVKPVESHLGVLAYVTAVPDSISSQFITYNLTESDAKNAFESFVTNLTNNLSRYRIEKVVAEGVYRQGEESEFESAAKVVDGIGLTGGSNPVVNTFGSFNGTAGNGRGNTLDRIHPKYYLKNEWNPEEKRNAIQCETEYDIETFKIWSDIKAEDLKSILHFTGPGSGSNFDIDISSVKLKPALTSKEAMKDAVYNLVASQLKSHSEWDELNRVTGFVDNYINALDFNMGNNKKTRNADTSLGTYTNATSRENWYNEGQNGLCCVRLKADCRLHIDNKLRWEVLDPALCGQAVSHYDLRNWGDNNNDGIKDDNLKSKGSLKDKVRTCRYQLSKGYSYYSSTDVYDNKEIDKRNRTANEEEDEENDDTATDTDIISVYGEDGLIGYFRDGNDDYYDIYCDNMQYALKSKLFYQDNATVEDSNK